MKQLCDGQLVEAKKKKEVDAKDQRVKEIE